MRWLLANKTLFTKWVLSWIWPTDSNLLPPDLSKVFGHAGITGLYVLVRRAWGGAWWAHVLRPWTRLAIPEEGRCRASPSPYRTLRLPYVPRSQAHTKRVNLTLTCQGENDQKGVRCVCVRLRTCVKRLDKPSVQLRHPTSSTRGVWVPAVGTSQLPLQDKAVASTL